MEEDRTVWYHDVGAAITVDVHYHHSIGRIFPPVLSKSPPIRHEYY